MKLHLYDYDHDKKIPYWARYPGHSGALCGYQRQNITFRKDEVTCHWCLSKILKKEKLS
jgi:hypothetical protein